MKAPNLKELKTCESCIYGKSDCDGMMGCRLYEDGGMEEYTCDDYFHRWNGLLIFTKSKRVVKCLMM